MKRRILAMDARRFPSVAGWFNAIRGHGVFAADAKRTFLFMKELKHLTHERRRLSWSGDRMEWLMSRGFHIRSGSVSGIDAINHPPVSFSGGEFGFHCLQANLLGRSLGDFTKKD